MAAPTTLTLEKTEELPSCVRVRDYDELSEDCQSLVTTLLNDDTAGTAGANANSCSLTVGEYIRFTGYFRIEYRADPT
ncbi:hypothetical protein ACLI4Q_07150 [Natrialbaceae archaeon A-CW1-1]